ncbi:anthranilate synthase component 1 [Corallincola luteus]|uniref:Anthranilate synthase component 1 n=1 Tax=Corallincola luteus TaxID=1775177 RepID=A0ABY2AKB3_9GAMM|nr:anthranilate synthase component 1 [Corallincola luteus]TCI01817.1 anthranilate synthase component 1 [Corallincola luteus]
MSHLASGEVEALTTTAPYVADPLALYELLTHHGELKNTVLLESAEIDSKADLKSLLLLDAALKISCSGRQVTLTLLSDNGRNALSTILSALPDSVAVVETDNGAVLNFPEVGEILDEEERLKALSPLEALRAAVNHLKTRNSNDDAIFLAGTFAYDLIASFEPLPDVADGENNCPDYLFYLSETLIVIDHQTQQSEITGCVFGGDGASEQFYLKTRRIESLKEQLTKFNPSQLSSKVAESAAIDVTTDTSDEQFCQQVETLKDNIHCGDIFQVVPSRSFHIACPDSLFAYRELKASNPSPYMFYVNDEEFVLFGASPESALKYEQEDRQVEVYPIAGTRRRGFNPDGSIDADLDSRMELELRLDKKELAEHIMLVDLARNDIARIAKPASRHVAELLKVDRYSHVMHLVSRVVGELREDMDALHAYQACMNMGTLVGAPKIRAAQLIRDTEGKRRGSYGGAVGYINGVGDMNTCIVIRSAFVKNGKATIQAGAGVVFDSQPQAEADETRNKAQAVISAIVSANKQLNQAAKQAEGAAHE